MSLITDIIGQTISVDVTTANYEILDNIYSHNAIWLQDAQTLLNIPSFNLFGGLITGIPLPLIGFSYRLNGEIELISYEWSEYPYLSKQIITNAGMKQPTKFSVDVYSVLTAKNPVSINLLKLGILKKTLEYYLAKGGLFTVLTLFGNISDCVLEKVTGISGDDSIDGTHLRFSFSKPNIDNTSEVTQQVTDMINKLGNGAAQIV